MARLLAGLALLLASVASSATAQFGLVTLPMDDPAYVQLGALERSGCAAARISIARPYEVRLVRAALAAGRTQPACEGPIWEALRARFAPNAADSGDGVRGGGAATLRLTALHNGEFEPLWDNVRPTSAGDPAAVGVLRGRVTWGEGDRAVIVADAYGATSIRNDPLNRAGHLRHTSGVIDLSEAYGSARAGIFSFTLGRGNEAWLGEGRESMVLSANGPPIDRIAAAFHTAHFEGRAFFGVVDDVVLDSARDSITTTIGPQRYYRYFAGHVLSWRPSRAIEVTAGETALIATGSRTVDLIYVNPFVPYQIARHDTGRAGFDAGDLTAFVGVRGRLGRATGAAELLINDIQIDALGRSRAPDQLGYELTASVPLPIAKPATLEVDYRRVDSYTYLDRFYARVYQAYNQPLGSQLGPDADDARIAADIFPVGWVRLAADVGVWRRGVLRISQRPGADLNGHANAPFPTSATGRPVQTAVLGNVSVQLLTPVLPITARIQMARIRNPNNLPVGTATYARAQLVATYGFRYP